MSTKPACINRKRFVIAILCFLGLFNAYAMRSFLSIVIVEMVSWKSESAFGNDETCSSDDMMTPKNRSASDDTCSYNCTTTSSNKSTSEVNASHERATKETFVWDGYTLSLIFYSFDYGYVITLLPGSFFAKKYGGKHTFGFGILISAILTILTPTAVYIGDSTALIVLRVLMGLAQGVTYPASSALLAKWTPPEERSRTASFVYTADSIGTIFATIVSGWILEYSSVGWPLVFYVMGGIGAVWYLFWLILCYENPRDHPFITQREANYLKDSMKDSVHEKITAVPWRHIFSSKAVWAAMATMIGFSWMNSIVTIVPTYIRFVLQFSVSRYLTSLIHFCIWIGGNTTSWLADCFISQRNVSPSLVRKIFSILAMPVAAAFAVAASYAECDQLLVTVMFAVSFTLMGSTYPSVMTNPLDLSPNYAGTMMALTTQMWSLPKIFIPYVIGMLTPNMTLVEWRCIFWIIFGVASFYNLIFLAFGSGDVQYWNNPDFRKL